MTRSSFVVEALPKCPRCGDCICEYTSDAPQPPACRIRELEQDNRRLESIVEEIWAALYGQGFMVAGWHLNGDLEPLDSWFEQNVWEAQAAAKEAGS